MPVRLLYGIIPDLSIVQYNQKWHVMALTKTDLQQIRAVIDDSIARHPRFSEIDARFGEMNARFDRIDARFDEIKVEIIDETAELIQGFMGLVDKRFTI